MKDLRLESLVVLHPGTASYPLGEHARVIPLAALAGETMDTLFPSGRSRGSRKPLRNVTRKRAGKRRGAD